MLKHAREKNHDSASQPLQSSATKESQSGAGQMDYETVTLMRMKHASDQLSREQRRKQALEELQRKELDDENT